MKYLASRQFIWEIQVKIFLIGEQMDYKEERKRLIAMMTKIFQQDINTKEYITKSAKMLGLKTIGKEIYFDSKEEQESYWDFTTYERITNDKSLFENAIDNKLFEDKEKDYLKNIKVFKKALYNVGESDGITTDITNIEDGTKYKLYDIGLSKNNINGYLLFFRMLKYNEYNMTSGFSYLFSEDIKPVVLRRKEILLKNEYLKNIDITLFRVFLKLNRIYGTEIHYK
jgi:hypothetical protein